MNPRPEVVRELRSMFRAGATPSRLIGHLAERHDGERHLHALIQAYFAEAFGIPIVRGLNPTDSFLHADLRYAHLNGQLVRAMVEHRDRWDDESESGNPASWLDDLPAGDDDERLRQSRATVVPELQRCWTNLTPGERDYLQRAFATANGLHESVTTLSRLAEALQLQLAELQSEATATHRG